MARKTTTRRAASAADTAPASSRKRRASAAAPRATNVGTTRSSSAAPPAAVGPHPTPAATPSTAGPLESAADVLGRTLGRTAALVERYLPWARGSDGLALLERDHRLLEGLLKQGVELDEAKHAERRATLALLVRVLTVHEQIEEKVLYPVLKSHPETKDIVLEGYQEHHVADVLVKELQALPPSDERWGAKLKVLQESLEHHIEEEESDMFKTARSVLTGEQLAALGDRMQEMKADLERA